MKARRKSGLTLMVALCVLTTLSLIWTLDAEAVSKKDLRRVSEGNSIEIIVLYLNPLEKDPGEDLSFEVRMDTHSADLDGYKVDKLSVLQINDGEELGPLGWFNPGGGGHHMSGTLKFKGPVPDGAGKLRLTIRDIGSVPERVFEWNLPLK